MDVPKKLHPFAFWGVHFTENIVDEFIATCPFCLHDDSRTGKGHFYVNKKTGAYDCKSCGTQGGIKQFLKTTYLTALKETNEDHLRKFTKAKGIPLPTLKAEKVAYHSSSNRYFLPVYDIQNNVTDLRNIILGRKEISTGGCNVGLIGLPELLKEENELVYICEGWSDALALRWLLKRTRNSGIVVATPGANSFKDSWGNLFTGKKCIICYDNDEAGYGFHDKEANKVTGSFKVDARIKNYTESVSFLCWPSLFKKGYDIRELVIEKKKIPETAYKTFISFIKPKHKFDIEGTTEEKETPLFIGDKHTAKEKFSLDNIIEIAKDVYQLSPNFINGIKLALATNVSIKIPGNDNVWLFFVGPPASGKTLILGLFETSNKCIWQSTLTSKGLISGYGTGQGAPTTGGAANSNSIDPSILGQVNNKCLVLKDFTEILEKHISERNEVFSILRGAYDGRIRKPFGTGFREYICNFGILAGVTPAIRAYDTTSLGERFLYYNIINNPQIAEEVQEKALNAQLLGSKKSKDLQKAVKGFLDIEYDMNGLSLMARIPKWFRDKVKPLGRLVACLRTTVSRFEYGHRQGKLKFIPISEAGNRATIQLEKLALGLCLIENKKEIDEEIYALIKVVAMDTINSFQTEIIKVLAKANLSQTELQIKAKTRLEYITAYIEDLETLKFVEKNGNKESYQLTKLIKDLWKRASL